MNFHGEDGESNFSSFLFLMTVRTTLTVLAKPENVSVTASRPLRGLALSGLTWKVEKDKYNEIPHLFQVQIRPLKTCL